jgi:rubredoxin
MSWATFSGDEVAALTGGESFFAAPAERVCPACGRRRLRAYVTSPAEARRPTLVSYAWCGACRKFVGTRSKHPEGLVFSDPLALLPDAERRDLERTLTGFLAHLDRLWDDGVLPQTFAA